MAQPRPRLGKLLKATSVLVAVVAVGGLIIDVVDPLANAQPGVRFGYGFGAFVRTVLLGVLAMWLFVKGRSVTEPERYGEAVMIRQDLLEIAERERSTRVDEPTKAAGFYQKYSDDDLVDVYRTIRRDKAPDRFAELLVEVRKRARSGDATREMKAERDRSS